MTHQCSHERAPASAHASAHASVHESAHKSWPSLCYNPLQGPVPVRLPAAAPGNHSACFRVRLVSAILAIRVCAIVWLRVLAIVLSVLLSLSLCPAKRVGEATGLSSRVSVFACNLSCFCVHGGGSLGGGGSIDPSVPRSPGTTL